MLFIIAMAWTSIHISAPPVTERPTVPQTTPTLAPVVTPSRVILGKSDGMVFS